MKQFCLILSFFFLYYFAYSQNEFAINNTNCFGNDGIDDVKYQFQTPDGSTIAFVSVEHKTGYFQSDYDNSIWLVKFDNHLNLVAKEFIAIQSDYSLASGFKFKINKISNTILCVADSSAGNESFINRLLVFDFNLNKLSSINIDERKTFETQENANNDGGFLVKYYVYDINYTPDSIGIVVINSDGSLRFKKYIPKVNLDTVKYLAYTAATISSSEDWFNNIIIDSELIYTTSIVYTYENINSYTSWIGITLDSNLNVVSSKLIENRYNDGSGSHRTRFCQLSDSSFLYASNQDLRKMRLYFLDKNYDTISSPFIADRNNYYNEILDNQFEYYFGQYPFNIKVGNDLVYIPYFHKLDTCPNPVPCFSSSSILCFNFIGQLIKEITLSRIPSGIQQRILNYKILNDESIITFTENANNEGIDIIVSKFNHNGEHIWSYTLPIEINADTTQLNFSYNYIPPQIIYIAGRERSIQIPVQYSSAYSDVNYVQQLWNFEINLDNGLLLDSTILSTIKQEKRSNDNHKWINVQKMNDDAFSVLGVSNIMCRDNNIDLFSATSSKNFNTIVSKVFLDLNSNSILDNNEHYLSDVSINVTKNNTTAESYFNENGYIVNYVDTGKYEITAIHNISYYNAFPASVIKNYTTYGNIDTLLFALQPIANVNDLMIQLNNNGRGRPGFNGSYILNVINNGTTLKNATAKLKLPDNMDSIFSIPSAAVNNDTLNWTFNNLEPCEQRIVELYFHYKEPPVNNIGDTLISTAIVLPIDNDTFPDNNISKLHDVLSGSYDPNDKTADKTEYTSDDISNKEYIKYTIRFENTGNDTAFSIVIVDTLDVNLDIATFIPLNGKYSYTAKITKGNVLTFTFNPIRLPEHATSSVSYLIKPKNSLTNGLSIKNKAAIKFDYNEPIVTNSTQTRISVITGIQNNKNTLWNIKLYPNPAKEEITIEFNDVRTINNIQVIDILGHVIKDIPINKMDKFLNLNIHELPAGSYILNVIDRNNAAQSVKFLISK